MVPEGVKIFLVPQEGNKLLGAFLCALKAPAPIFEVYGRVGLNRRDSVLDVGGGGGGHVRALRAIGFNEALAIDPFIEADVTLEGQLRGSMQLRSLLWG